MDQRGRTHLQGRSACHESRRGQLLLPTQSRMWPLSDTTTSSRVKIQKN